MADNEVRHGIEVTGEKVSSIPVEIGDLDRVREAVSELQTHLQAAQSLLDELGVVELDVIAITSE